ncbi:uncharacterized protein [Drosophila pseudoobscura]|uniref:Uncharacterized protein n=1 Tax=Drosophila pseudoobscura pseudoobscura TaxID=46245 RepID=A0A6I8VY34_DROPS|nr:uncharacterized protein LOC117184025 [Drosophila pseudoobscura]
MIACSLNLCLCLSLSLSQSQFNPRALRSLSVALLHCSLSLAAVCCPQAQKVVNCQITKERKKATNKSGKGGKGKARKQTYRQTGGSIEIRNSFRNKSRVNSINV